MTETLSLATRKLAEIKKDKIYRFKEAFQYGMNFRVKDIREKKPK
ncbi:hypothetical protein [Borreliella bavariensis]|nr:hypothetical protein [Borreliella bavariensis]